MRHRILSILAGIGFVAVSTGASADPPIGHWVGDHGSLDIMLSPDGNYVIPGNSIGHWSWQQSGPTGGILTLNYDTVTVTQTFHNSMYFSIEFSDANTATLTEPVARVTDTIRRQQ
jgi:hypothetical protein